MTTKLRLTGGFYNITLIFHMLHCFWLLGAAKHLWAPFKVPYWVYIIVIGNIIVQTCAIEGMLTVILSGGFNTDAFQEGLASGTGWSKLQQWALEINEIFNVGTWNWMLALTWRMLTTPPHLYVAALQAP